MKSSPAKQPQKPSQQQGATSAESGGQKRIVNQRKEAQEALQLLQTIKQSVVAQRAGTEMHRIRTSAVAQLQKDQVAQLKMFGNIDHAEKSGRAGVVEAEDVHGSTYGEGHNSPSDQADVFGWDQLHAAGHTLGNQNSTHYNAVRMHLFNGRLDGPGNVDWNLAPGPAQINSSMSAGPETAAKNAVDSGKRIWSKTEVWYQNNGNNASDFTNVVPNRMKMEWGYMQTADNRIAPKISFDPNDAPHHKGGAENPAWDLAIDQPAGALSNQAKQAYTDLDENDTVGLVNKFNVASNQEKVQAFELVKLKLQAYIINNYPEVYMSMGDGMRATILTAFDLPFVANLITAVLKITEPNRLNSEVYYPLIKTNNLQRLQAIFNLYDDNAKREQLLNGKLELITALQNAADDIIMNEYKYFKYYSLQDQATRFDGATPLQRYNLMESLAIGTWRKELLSAWARSKGINGAAAKVRFVTLAFSGGLLPMEKYAKEYRSKMKYELDNEKKGPRKRYGRKAKVKKF